MSHRLIFFGFAVLLAGCSVTTPELVKPGAGPGDFATDKTYCENRSSAAVSTPFSGGLVGTGAYIDCMHRRGWVSKDSTPPAPRP